MTLSRDLQEWKERFSALLAEGIELLSRIEEKEEQNSVLQESLTTAAQGEIAGFEALQKLYGEGFHICHARFAQMREEECLFCLSFFQNEGIIENEKLDKTG